METKEGTEITFAQAPGGFSSAFFFAVVSPADERPDAVPSDGRHAHRHGLGGGQPVGVVVAGGEVAHVVDVAEQERHCAEFAQAAAGRACTRRDSHP